MNHVRSNRWLLRCSLACAMFLGFLAVIAYGGAHEKPRKTNDPASAPANVAQTQPATQPTQWGSPYGYGVMRLGNGIDLKLALIPAGKFPLGNKNELSAHIGNAQYDVTITKPYYMGIYLVTWPEYIEVMGVKKTKELELLRGYEENTYFRKAKTTKEFLQLSFDETKKSLKIWHLAPVRITFKEAMEFCLALSRKIDNVVRLPTQAEWERACKAGTTTIFFFGDKPRDLRDYSSKKDVLHGVGAKKPNPWGLYDMYSGWQMCSDWDWGFYYKKGAKHSIVIKAATISLVDPTGPPEPVPNVTGHYGHVLKGGVVRETPGQPIAMYISDYIRTVAIIMDEEQKMRFLQRIVVEYPLVTPKDCIGVVKFQAVKQGKYLDETSYLVGAWAMGNMVGNNSQIMMSVVNNNLPMGDPAKASADTTQAEIRAGTLLQLAIPNTSGEEAKNLPAPEDESLYKTFQDAKAGDLFKVKFTVLNGQKIGEIVPAEPYKIVPGEDQPGVYVFQRMSRVGIVLEGAERPVVVISKFLEETTLAIMDVDILAALDKFKTGDSVRVKTAGKTLKSIEAYRP